MIYITSKRLKIEICEPGEGDNCGSRFDRAGYIRQVTLDGKYHFCENEPDNLSQQCSGGAGICSEICCEGVDTETSVGEYFPKFGVGLLLKPDDNPYIFHRRYECMPFRVDSKRVSSSISFGTEQLEHAGRSLLEEKTIWVEDNVLTMEYKFVNTGTKPLNLSEYSHDFVTLNGLHTGPDYRLEMPALFSQEGKRPPHGNGTMMGTRTGFSFSAPGVEPSFIPVSGEEMDRTKPFSWTLAHSVCPLRITGEPSLAPESAFIWSVGNIVSPEVFIRFALIPDDRITYRRRWTFEY